jgi:hypothetical protein
MQQHIAVLCLAGIAAGLCGCRTPRGDTVAEKQAYVGDMVDDTLNELYERHPEARAKMDLAVGYAVFSEIGSALGTGGMGNGYGVAVDKETGQETYMRALMLTGGVGLGIKDFRQVLFFYDSAGYDCFVKTGWEIKGQADANATLDDSGGGISATVNLAENVEMYHFIENGFFLRAAVEGTRYWPDSELNER